MYQMYKHAGGFTLFYNEGTSPCGYKPHGSWYTSENLLYVLKESNRLKKARTVDKPDWLFGITAICSHHNYEELLIELKNLLPEEFI